MEQTLANEQRRNGGKLKKSQKKSLKMLFSSFDNFRIVILAYDSSTAKLYSILERSRSQTHYMISSFQSAQNHGELTF